MRHGFDEIYKRMKKAIVRHQMIADDTPIMVGLSGGKDSLTLLWAAKKILDYLQIQISLSRGACLLRFSRR